MDILALPRHLIARLPRRWLESVYLVTGLLGLTLGPVYTVRLHAAPLDVDFTADVSTQLFFVLLYGTAAVLLARTVIGWRWLRRPLLALGAVCALLVLSTSWSVRPTDTFTSSVLTAGTALFGVYLAVRWSPLALAGGLYVSSLVGVGISLWAVQRKWPGAKDYSADWVGIYLNRNSLGPVATMGVLSGVFVVASLASRVAQRRPHARTRAALLTAFAALPIYPCYRVVRHTRSYSGVAGALAALAASGLLLVLLVVFRRRAERGQQVVTAMAFTAVVSIIAVDRGRDRLATSVDKLPTLSGRTIIWAVVRRWFHLRPSKGWGWMGIWRDTDFRADLDATGYHVFSAHSGYLEVALGTGWLGVLVLAIALLVLGIGVLLWSARRADLAGLWFTALLTYCLVVNTAETYIGANLLPWALLAAVGVGAVHHPARAGVVAASAAAPT